MDGPSTATLLSMKLGVSAKAVDCHLYRMKDREVTKLKRGIYELAGTVPAVEPTPKAEATPTTAAPIVEKAKVDPKELFTRILRRQTGYDS